MTRLVRVVKFYSIDIYRATGWLIYIAEVNKHLVHPRISQITRAVIRHYKTYTMSTIPRRKTTGFHIQAQVLCRFCETLSRIFLN